MEREGEREAKGGDGAEEFGFKNALSYLGKGEKEKLEKRPRVGNQGPGGFQPG